MATSARTRPAWAAFQHHLETFLARAAAEDPLGEGVPDWVEEDFRAYLRGGILAHGFARVRLVSAAAGDPSGLRGPHPEEIDQERYALKAMRGGFRGLTGRAGTRTPGSSGR
jgi:hypothetical protein